MTTSEWVLLGVLELAALIVAINMWRRRRHKLGLRLVWSLVLLIPLFGLMIYFFLREHPDRHPYDSDELDFEPGRDD